MAKRSCSRYPRLQPEDESRVIEGFREQRAGEYAEIIEECATKFVKEIEFERFRENYTFEEAEEIEQDLEKIRHWFERVRERDWFKADRRNEVEAWLARCQGMLARFEEDVYRRQSLERPSEDAQEDETEESIPEPRPITPLRPVRSRARRARASGHVLRRISGERDAEA